MSPPSHLPPHPTLQLVTEPLFEFPESYSKFPLAIYFTYDNACFHVTLSIHPTLNLRGKFEQSFKNRLLVHHEETLASWDVFTQNG